MPSASDRSQAGVPAPAGKRVTATGLSGDIKPAPRGQRLPTPERQGVRWLSRTVRAHASMTPARKPLL